MNDIFDNNDPNYPNEDILKPNQNNNNPLDNLNNKNLKIKEQKNPLNKGKDDKYHIYQSPQEVIDSQPDKEGEKGNELKNLRDRLKMKTALDRLKKNKKNSPKDKNNDLFNKERIMKNKRNLQDNNSDNLNDDNQFPIIDNLEGDQFPNNRNQYPNNKVSPKNNNLIPNPKLNNKQIINDNLLPNNNRNKSPDNKLNDPNNILNEPNNLLNNNINNPDNNNEDINIHPIKQNIPNSNLLNENKKPNSQNPIFDIESDDPGYDEKKKDKRPKSYDNKKIGKLGKNKLKYPNYLKNKKDKSYSPNNFHTESTCWACDVHCSVSSTGYSPMTFSPYDVTYKRKNITYVEPNIQYEEYTKHKKKNKDNNDF